MDVREVLDVVLTLVAIALTGVAIYAVVVLIRSLRDVTEAVNDARDRLVPLLDKVDVTVDVLNAELLRLDAIVTQAEEVGDAVSHAGEFIRSPLHKAAEGIARIAHRFGKR
jgi:ABC-type transporter Mla subunit MlaD